MAHGWTSERRARQAALIRNWRPWERSTGPRTTEGKAKAANNAYKGGERLRLRALAFLLRKMPALLAAGYKVDPRLVEMWEQEQGRRQGT